ncbi:MAG: translocation/assembly module TamB domain-containing protein [Colwellia sp.]|uniref:translocation/assembly module TamB domain-containing protein n=1 Tax=Colwellia sp. TaxID=56799 RepID=UPI001D42D486|nr:translocation/assembly module TamB domain-containing protein [Colwellia sp.]NQY49031.1 translocation/assembly module TamB domain-containing protein [Colwellia sp.]
MTRRNRAYKVAYKLTYKVIKWLTLLFCLFTVLLTTPIGSQLTISLLNNIDGINADYKAGSLIRDIELNSFHLNLATLDIKVTDLAAKINFSCSWQKKLCIESLQVARFSLTYLNENKEEKSKDTATVNPAAINHDSLFVMPFAIEAKAVAFSNSHLVINQTVIDIEQFTAQVDIKASQFTILQPNAEKLTIVFDKNSNSKSISAEKSKSSQLNNNGKANTNSIYAVFSTLPKVYLPISLNIQQLYVDKLRIIDHQTLNNNNNNTLNSTLKSDMQWPYQQSHLSGTWVKSDVNITDFKTTTTDFEIKQSTLNTELIPPYKIKAKLVAQLDKIPHWPQASDSIVELSLQGSFDNLSVNIASKGSVILTSQGQINLTHQQLPFKLQLSADKLPLPLSLAQYGKPSSLSLNVAGDLIEQTINLTSQLNSYGYKNARLKLSAKHKQGLITLKELAFNEQDSDSQISVHGNINFQSNLTSWQLSANSTGFTLPKINIKALVFPEETNINNSSTNIGTNAFAEKNSDINNDFNTASQTRFIEDILPNVINGRLSGEITSSGSWSASHWSLSVNDTDVSGTINDSALIIQGDIALNQSGYFSSGDLAQGKLLVVFDQDQLTLQTFSGDNWHVNGQLFIADMAHWYKEVSGSFTSDFTIKGSKADPIITLNSKLNNLQWQKFYSPSLEVTASYQPFNNHKAQLTLKNAQLDITNKSDELSMQNIILNVSGDINQQQLQLDWQGDLAGKLKFTSQWYEALNQWQSTIEEAALTYQQETWRNNNVFSLNFNVDKQQLFIGKHCWQGTDLDICLPNDAIIGESGNITLGLNMDLSLFDAVVLPKEVQLQSRISGEIQAQWSPTQEISAQANFSLSSGNVKVIDEYNEQQVSQWRHGKFTFNINQGQLTSKLQLHDSQEQALININSKVNFIDDFPIDVQIELNQFNLQPFQGLISNVVNLQGLVSALLTVKGTVKTPLINGSLTLDNGELLLSQNPNKLEHINAELQIDNNQAKIIGDFSIKDNKATLNGQLAWQDDLTMDIDLYAKQLPLVFPPQLVMKISPRLNFSLEEKTLTITGMLNVLAGSYNIEKLPQGSVDLSDDVIIIDDQGKEVFKEKSGLAIKTDVSINIAKTFIVSGQGLESNLFGQLQVTQQKKQPLQLFGIIQSENGTYQAYGQKLTIDKGELTFNGPLTNPYFNLRASRHIKAEDIEVGLQITGLADNLDMQLFSTPTMESPEMLSYLARGRGLDSGGGSSSAAASMLIGFGVTNSVGLFDQLEKIPLINNIAVDTEGEGDSTQATISGYIGNRVYLKYGIGVYEPINELTVRLFLLNRLWLEIVSGIEQSSDLYYSFDID